MLQPLARFSSDFVGVEKTLKLLQSTSQIAANIGYWTPDEAAQWTIAKNQFAFARRFFRLFKWIDCWNIAYSQFDSKSDANDGKINVKRAQAPQDSLHFLLVFAKWSLLGVYLFLEMFTIVDAVTGTWRPWAVTAQIESLKLWFYALSVSVVLDLYEIFVVYPELATSPATKPGAAAEKPASERARENKNEEANPDTQAVSTRAAKRRALYRQLVIDGCDALIPGATVGWLGLDPVTVGAVGTISAIVGGSDAWVRVNS